MSHPSITELLFQWREGDRSALDKLIPLVEKELRRLASYYMRRQRPGHTMQTSDLINEAYLRLVDYKNMQWQNRAHFFAMAAQAMRRVLVAYARRKGYAKRGGANIKVGIDEASGLAHHQASELIALDEALTELERLDPRKARVVELRYFGGMSVDETAEALDISGVTVMRDWNAAKGWLLRELSQRGSNDA
jgi:RNA polymerase sigma factor (TIGR02999 family)